VARDIQRHFANALAEEFPPEWVHVELPLRIGTRSDLPSSRAGRSSVRAGVTCHFPRRSLPSSVLLPPAFGGEGCCCRTKSSAHRYAYTDAGVAEQKHPGLRA
jgi:hypothetical protein